MKSIVRKVLSILTLILIAAISFAVLVPVLEAHADTALDEIRILASTSKAMEGDLPMFSVGYASEHVVSVEPYGSNTAWAYWGENNTSWQSFGLETPVAVPDNTTHYALMVCLTFEDGYRLANNTAIYLNDVNMTEYGHTMAVHMEGTNNGYVFIDLGTAGVWPPRTEDVTIQTILIGGGGTYEVTYDTEHETENTNTTLSSSSMYIVPAGTEMRLSAEPAIGYYFAGWYTAREIDPDNSGNTTFLQNQLLTTNLFLDYRVDVDEYLMPVFVYGDAEMIEVTVDVNGGNPINPNVAQGFKGELVGEILLRSLAEYEIELTHSDETKVFFGICADSLCETEIDGDYVVYDDMTVYLKWVTPTPHTLTYNLNYYGDERDIRVETIYEEVPIEFIEDPSIEGMTFDGWFEDPECQVFFEYGDGRLTEDKMLYAYWRRNIDSIELTVAAPHVGDMVTLNDNNEPNIVPNVTSASENYGSHHPDWVNGVCSAESNACNELFSGTFAADTDYYARIDIHAEDGYALTTDTLDHITVNGEAPAEIFTVYGRIDTTIIARLRSSEEGPTQNGPYTVHFVRYTGSGEMEDIIKNAGEELTFPECEFAAPSGMKFNVWFIDDEEGRSYFWPGDTMVINNNVDVVVDWTQENFIGTFRATVSGPVIGDAITVPSAESGDEKYTAEIVDWYSSNDMDALGDALSDSAVFAAETPYMVKVKFTTVGDYRTAYPTRVLINDRMATVWVDSNIEVYGIIAMDVNEGSNNPGEPEQPSEPEYNYILTKQNTTNLEVLYETDIEELVGQKKQEFFSHFSDTHGLNLDALFSIYEPYKFAEYNEPSTTIYCYDVVDQEVECNGYESRKVYSVKYYYDEVLVTRKTTITVQFNTNGGGGMDELEVLANQPMDEPEEEPERAGYSFAGWSKSEAVIDEVTGAMNEGKSLFDFSTPLTGETTLVANWKKVYEVSFDTGTMLPVDRIPEAQLVIAGNVPTVPKDMFGRQLVMEYGEYTREGFYLDAGFTTEYNGQPIVNDTVIYVKWHNTLDDYEKVEEVNLTIASPAVGTVVTMTGDDWDTQTPQPLVTVPEGADYSLDDNGGNWNYAYWLLEKDFDSDAFLGTMVKGGVYYADIYISTNNEDYIFDKNVVVKVNGNVVSAEYVDYDVDLLEILVEVTPTETAYTILEGANQVHSIVDDVDKDIIVKASGELEKLDRVEIDGVPLGEGNGDVASGSTVVTLKAGYLNTLALGVHTLKFVYNDGEVATNFTIVDSTVEDNPFTADESGIFKMMFVISLVGLSLGWLRLKSLARNDRSK